MSGSTSSANYIGSGSDTITLNMSEDQALGVDAEFTVNVDGKQIGDLQGVTASHSSGQEESFTFAGNFDPGSHNVTVTFANNFIYPGQSGDRNVYVDSVTYDGQVVSNKTTPIYESPIYPPNSTSGNILGNAVFSVNDSTAVPNGAPSSSTTTPGAVSVGSGSDTLVLNMAEDPYQGDAQFTVSVDGQQIGGTQTTSAIVEEGQQQEFDIHGNFGGGSHTVSVNFLNDLVGGYYPSGTPGLPANGQWAVDTTDRNLYVMGMSLNGGSPASGTPWELSSNGSFSWNVAAGSNTSAPVTTSAAVTPDTAPITTSSLTASDTLTGSASGMNFVASPTTSGTTTGTTTTTAGSGSTGTTTDTTPLAASTSGTAQTAQDFTVPTTSSSGSDTTGTTAGSGNAWMTSQATNTPGMFHYHQV